MKDITALYYELRKKTKENMTTGKIGNKRIYVTVPIIRVCQVKCVSFLIFCGGR